MIHKRNCIKEGNRLYTDHRITPEVGDIIELKVGDEIFRYMWVKSSGCSECPLFMMDKINICKVLVGKKSLCDHMNLTGPDSPIINRLQHSLKPIDDVMEEL